LSASRAGPHDGLDLVAPGLDLLHQPFSGDLHGQVQQLRFAVLCDLRPEPTELGQPFGEGLVGLNQAAALCLQGLSHLLSVGLFLGRVLP
jgi:hypothetical protein